MKTAFSVAAACFLLGLGAIVYVAFHPSIDLFVGLVIFVVSRGLLVLAVIIAAIAFFVDTSQRYVALPEKERQAINEIACPAIDAGLHHLKQRDDDVGKVAAFLHKYRRYARRYQK